MTPRGGDAGSRSIPSVEDVAGHRSRPRSPGPTPPSPPGGGTLPRAALPGRSSESTGATSSRWRSSRSTSYPAALANERQNPTRGGTATGTPHRPPAPRAIPPCHRTDQRYRGSRKSCRSPLCGSVPAGHCQHRHRHRHRHRPGGTRRPAPARRRQFAARRTWALVFRLMPDGDPAAEPTGPSQPRWPGHAVRFHQPGKGGRPRQSIWRSTSPVSPAACPIPPLAPHGRDRRRDPRQVVAGRG